MNLFTADRPFTRIDNPHTDLRLLAGPGVPIETEAIEQALSWARMTPALRAHGGDLERMVLMPDLHVGAGIPVGLAAQLRDLIIPKVIGRDIGCGMRLLALPGLTADDVRSCRPQLTRRLRAIFFEGERALATSPRQRAAILQHGLIGLLETAADNRDHGLWQLLDERAAEQDLAHTHADGSFITDNVYAGYDKYVHGSGRTRQPDPQLGSLGGGNHMCELTVVDQITDPAAGLWQLQPGAVCVLIHSGSLAVGGAAAGSASDPAQPLHAEQPAGRAYLQAMSNATNFAYANRLCLGLMAVRALREATGRQLAAELVYDAPHNFIEPAADGRWLHRKGATPAAGANPAFPAGRPVIIPGSMGDGSWVCAGHGSAEALTSANHGAGRQLSRGAAARTADDRLEQLHVVTPIDAELMARLGRYDIVAEHQRRLREEAPGAYKPLAPLIDAVHAAGVARPVAHLAPLLTVKG